ncbi:hypothetical protein M408DRAFT_147960 [Serendipita vermifera MAFF 305830]|uniref:BRCT domain-containing protein n=1 Tax=Serendipita vermifera MAFF 305830 TaxID=933852 RepID=A0A0C2XGA7_SERVB|nr:hypothetical protein M408DRAFT_147960 [Serendipita vermifera MAFF 305830]
MERQAANLFRLEDGESLSIAVHSQVPQHIRIAALIRANNGVVVEDAISAHFCILSLNIPNVDGIVNELASKSKLVVQDYWIRDSIEMRRLLPWYSYEMVSPTSPSNDAIPDALFTSDEVIEARDVHELVIIMARYGLLLPSDDLHRHLSRKCPHRSVASFKNLYSTHRIDIDSRITYIRGKLDASLAFKSDYHKLPVISFESPNKPAVFAPSAAFLTPIGNGLGEQVSGNRETMTVSDEEAPYDPPNMENASRPNSPTIDRVAQEIRQEAPRTSQEMLCVELERPERPQVTLTSAVTIPQTTQVSKYSYSKPHGGITDEDKHALAKFLVKYPQGKTSWPEHMMLFEKKYTRGSVRSAWAWRNVYKMETVQQHIKRLNREKEKQPQVDQSPAKRTLPKKQHIGKNEEASKALARKEYVHLRSHFLAVQPLSQ